MCPFQTGLLLQKASLIELLPQNYVHRAVIAGCCSMYAFRCQDGSLIQALQPQQQATWKHLALQVIPSRNTLPTGPYSPTHRKSQDIGQLAEAKQDEGHDGELYVGAQNAESADCQHVSKELLLLD